MKSRFLLNSFGLKRVKRVRRSWKWTKFCCWQCSALHRPAAWSWRTFVLLIFFDTKMSRWTASTESNWIWSSSRWSITWSTTNKTFGKHWRSSMTSKRGSKRFISINFHRNHFIGRPIDLNVWQIYESVMTILLILYRRFNIENSYELRT